jgi:hypothetical protein
MVGYRPVRLIVMKRKHVVWYPFDPGHWWFEIGDCADDSSESYGWWPKSELGNKEVFEMLRGVEGELNGQTAFGGSPTRDVLHGAPADEIFHPVVSIHDRRSEAAIADCLRRFARGYYGEWRWTFGSGQNCHSFQESAMDHCGLKNG